MEPIEVHVVHDVRLFRDHHFDALIISKLNQLLTGQIQTKEMIMASGKTLDELLQDVADESTQIDSLTTLTAGIKQQLTDALSGVTLPPAVQAKVDAVFTAVDVNKAKVVDAINANTPAAEPPAP